LKIYDLYDRLVLGHARTVIAVLLVLFGLLGYRVRDLGMDATGDALVLEDDQDLRYYREIVYRYGTGDFLVLSFTPRGDLFGAESLAAVRTLRDGLKALPGIASVITLLDAPLLGNPPVPLKDMRANIKTLDSPGVDVELARREFRESPLYRNALVSSDLRTTALQISLARDDVLEATLMRRTILRDRKHDGLITPAERAELKRVSAAYEVCKTRNVRARRRIVAAVRGVVRAHGAAGTLFLGGIPMIADDTMAFIRRDVLVFGLGMLVFLVAILAVIFGRVRWVALPVLCCGCAVLVMMGLLGATGWKVTVISSNFVSLQLILTMSLAIHLIVRYRELQRQAPGAAHLERVRETVHSVFLPCLYCNLTTIAGFASLILCRIQPVIQFGWMMTAGLAVSLAVTFLLFPAALALMRPPAAPRARAPRFAVPALCARFASRHPAVVFAVSLAVLAGTAAGIRRLEVENSFINYYKAGTEIHKGMRVIDRELGGTTPMDVLIDFDAVEAASPGAAGPPPPGAPAEGDEAFDDFEEFDAAENAEKYWLTPARLETIARVHRYLESRPEIGKVLSLATLRQTAEWLGAARELDAFELALLFSQLPEEYRKAIVEPFVSVAHNQARVTMRVRDSDPALRRDALLRSIRADLAGRLGPAPGRARLSGVMVLYNNLLQSLYRSQVRTIGFTILALTAMFLVLFRSVTVAFVAILPNLLASMTVLGVMGLFRIPLDMMTITIVAISVGIAVDDTIHYIHRFRKEFAADGDYAAAMFRSHATVGHAMFYTSVAITAGFSILALSDFVPSILFGLLTSLAMVSASAASLLLLPRLILLVKPFGPGANADRSLPRAG